MWHPVACTESERISFCVKHAEKLKAHPSALFPGQPRLFLVMNNSISFRCTVVGFGFRVVMSRHDDQQWSRPCPAPKLRRFSCRESVLALASATSGRQSRDSPAKEGFPASKKASTVMSRANHGISFRNRFCRLWYMVLELLPNSRTLAPAGISLSSRVGLQHSVLCVFERFVLPENRHYGSRVYRTQDTSVPSSSEHPIVSSVQHHVSTHKKQGVVLDSRGRDCRWSAEGSIASLRFNIRYGYPLAKARASGRRCSYPQDS